MKVRTLHNWRVSVEQAIRLQERLSEMVIQEGEVSCVRLVAGCDVAYKNAQGVLFGGVVLWDLRQNLVVETQVARRPVTFPYVPGLLGFRETPVLLEALSRLRGGPDVLLIDGQGIAHPRGMGLASHLGLHTNVPAVGCAKTILVGSHDPLGDRRGSWVWLHFESRPVGVVMRTRSGVRPIYVSPGHRISIEEARRLVLLCLGRFRVPEPVRQAHLLVAQQKREAS
jgi:deoxyribonuclease V